MLRFALTGIENISRHGFQRFWFNSSGSTIYAALTNNDFLPNGDCPLWLYRICISAQSIHEIGLIDLPSINPAMAFDGEEKMYFLSSYWIAENNNEVRLRLDIFNTKEGIFKSYERGGLFDNRPVRFMSVSKGDIFIGDVISVMDDKRTIIYKVSALDEINATFDVYEFGKLAPCGDFAAMMLGIRIVEDGAVRSCYYQNQPGHIERCKFSEPWEKLDYAVIMPKAEPFEYLYGFYRHGDYKIEFGRSNSVSIFRVLKVKGQQPWEVVFSGPVPDAITTDYWDHIHHAYHSNRRQMAFFAIENTTLLMTIIDGPLCSLEELCFGPLWLQIGRLNPKVTDHEICHHLNVSLVGFGKVYYLQ